MAVLQGYHDLACILADLMAADCPSREVPRHLTSWWGVPVLIALRQGTRCPNGLARMVGGVNERMLAQTR